MTQNKYKPRIPDLMEAIFDIGYLGFGLIAGLVFLYMADGRKLFLLYGILTLVLCGGDAWHLVPRVVKALKGQNEKVHFFMNLGLQVSSITMTVFYILLLYIWKETFAPMEPPTWVVWIIWGSAIVRILICLLPQNNWYNGKGNMTLSLVRNGVFVLTGIGVIILYAMSGNTYDYQLNRMVAAIIISFGCYMPVTIWSKKKPMVGMLMIPKTCAYIWMIEMGLQLL